MSIFDKSPSKAKDTPAIKEPAVCIVFSNGVVKALIAHGNSAAAAQRLALKSITSDKDEHGFSRQIFGWDGESWTNISPKSTADNPMFSAGAIEACEKFVTTMNKCTAVGSVTLRDDDTGAIVSLSQVRAKTFVMPVPVVKAEPLSATITNDDG